MLKLGVVSTDATYCNLQRHRFRYIEIIATPPYCCHTHHDRPQHPVRERYIPGNTTGVSAGASDKRARVHVHQADDRLTIWSRQDPIGYIASQYFNLCGTPSPCIQLLVWVYIPHDLYLNAQLRCSQRSPSFESGPPRQHGSNNSTSVVAPCEPGMRSYVHLGMFLMDVKPDSNFSLTSSRAFSLMELIKAPGRRSASQPTTAHRAKAATTTLQSRTWILSTCAAMSWAMCRLTTPSRWRLETTSPSTGMKLQC